MVVEEATLRFAERCKGCRERVRLNRPRSGVYKKVAKYLDKRWPSATLYAIRILEETRTPGFVSSWCLNNYGHVRLLFISWDIVSSKNKVMTTFDFEYTVSWFRHDGN